MSSVFIQRNILARIDGKFRTISITVTKPIDIDVGVSQVNVTFSSLEKYSTYIKGMDEFNAIECAFNYIDSVCQNSKDPEFFMSENESMYQDYLK